MVSASARPAGAGSDVTGCCRSSNEPHIAPIYDAREIDGQLDLVMHALQDRDAPHRVEAATNAPGGNAGKARNVIDP